jgi:hypothetical protein
MEDFASTEDFAESPKMFVRRYRRVIAAWKRPRTSQRDLSGNAPPGACAGRGVGGTAKTACTRWRSGNREL